MQVVSHETLARLPAGTVYQCYSSNASRVGPLMVKDTHEEDGWAYRPLIAGTPEVLTADGPDEASALDSHCSFLVLEPSDLKRAAAELLMAAASLECNA